MKLQINQKELFNKLFVLSFVWLTPLSLVGIIRSSIVWSLVNGININIPWLHVTEEEISQTIEDIISQKSVVEETPNNEEEEESTGSSPEEIEPTTDPKIEVEKKGWGFKN